MAERYSRLFTLPSNLYTSGSPVVIAAGALLKDTLTGSVLAQLKLRSISPKGIKAIKVCITARDTASRILGAAVDHQYLDLNVQRNEEFGQKIAIPLPDASTRGFTVSVTEAILSDNSIWTNANTDWSPLPSPAPLMTEDKELVKQYQLTYGSQCRYSPLSHDDLWFCSCGAVNHADELFCHACQLEYARLRDVQWSALKAARDFRLAAEQEEAAKLAEEQAKKEMAAMAEAEKLRIIAAKKARKTRTICAALAIVAAVVFVVSYFVVPAQKRKAAYAEAQTMLENGSYEEAFQAFTALGDYEDSAEKAAAAKEAQMKDQPQQENQPNVPSEPATPETPAEPIVPSEPATPETPAEPVVPSEPATPETPSEPTVPSEPEVPETPAEPVIPSEPAVPETPTEPTVPAVPSVPDKATAKVYKTYLTSKVSSLNFLDNIDSNCALPASYVTSQLWRMYPNAAGTNYVWIDDLAVGDPVKIDDYNWQIKLRKGATFQDGTPITADTWIYTFQQMLDPDLQNSLAVFLYDNAITIRNAEEYYLQGYWGYPSYVSWDDVGLKKIDDYTLQVTTVSRHTDPNDIKKHFDFRCHTPIHPGMWDKCLSSGGSSTSYGSDMTKFIGSGPYVLSKWQPNSIQVYVKREDHWLADRFHFDTVEVRTASTMNARIDLFEAGEIHSLSLDADSVGRYINDPRLVRYGSIEVNHIDVNCKNPNNPISGSVNYRKALYHAIDRKHAAETIFGHMEPVGTYINDQAGLFSGAGLTYRQSAYGLAVTQKVESWGPYGYNPELARQYLAQALLECNVSDAQLPITIKYCVDSSDTEWLDFGYDLMEQWNTIFEGKVQLEIDTYSGMSVGQFKKTGDSKWDLCPNIWSRSRSRTYPHEAFYYFQSSYDNRPNNYTSSAFDTQYALCESIVSGSYDTLLKETQKLEEIYLEEVIHIPIYQESKYELFADQLILPVRTYIPGFGWGAIYGDLAE